MQRLIPQIDTAYISAPYGFSDLMTKEFSDYKYRKSGILLNSGIKKLTRYAKDYTLDGVNFTILLVSFSSAHKTIEKKMDEIYKQIKENNRLKSFVATATLNPISTGVTI